MGLKKITFNPLSAQFDYISEGVTIVAAAPTTGVEGVLYQVSTDPTKSYYFIGAHRYRIDAVLDDLTASGGTDLPLGLIFMANLR